jgi:hypothetical protein
MSRSEIVPAAPSRLSRTSWLLLAFALVLGACSLAMFDTGRSVLGVAAGVPALVAFVAAIRHRLRPFVLHASR